MNFRAKYSSEKMFMIELLGDLKVFGTFHLSPIGKLAGYMRNSNVKKLL
jgi:hypothetical protein